MSQRSTSSLTPQEQQELQKHVEAELQKQPQHAQQVQQAAGLLGGGNLAGGLGQILSLVLPFILQWLADHGKTAPVTPTTP